MNCSSLRAPLWAKPFTVPHSLKHSPPCPRSTKRVRDSSAHCNSLPAVSWDCLRSQLRDLQHCSRPTAIKAKPPSYCTKFYLTNDRMTDKLMEYSGIPRN